MSDSAANGRGGLGSIYVFSAGNDRDNQDNTNYSGLTNNRYVTTVAAVADDGQVADYSTPGANVLVSAPSNGGFSSITTTDRVGSAAGTVGYSTTDYTDTFGGTSSAAPVVSGVIAQMLQANPNLSWRDVQHILVRSATRVDPASTGWDANPAVAGAQPNGGGRWVSDDYGFGLVNAEGAVNLASNWQPVGPELVYDSGQKAVNAAIPDNTGAAVTDPITVPASANIRVEHVEVVFTAAHPDRGQLEVTLTSPSGTQSVLAATRTNDPNANYSAWTFGTVRDWDETSAGTWTLSVKDPVTGPVGAAQTFTNWRLRVYGTEITSDTPGPRVAGITSPAANGMVNGGSIQVFRVQFDRPIDPVTFTPDDITFQRVGGAATAVSQILPVNGAAPSDTAFDVTLASPVSTVGNYRVDIGPNIADPSGTLMNQDGDLTNGEATQDRYTEFVTLADQFLYFQANNPGWSIPSGGSFTAGWDVPAVNTTDINVWAWALHDFAGNNLKMELQAPGDVFREVARDATPPGNGINGNGFRNTVLDDEAPTTFGVTDNYQYTGSYKPTTTPLSTFEGSKPPGAWNLRFDNSSGAGAGVWYSGMILTPAGVPNVTVNGVTNTDADRGQVEVAYTIANAAPPSLDLGVYGSTDPFWNVNSDTQTGTQTITDPALLTVGPHTVKLSASLFPDPSFAANQELYSLVVADPQHRLLELAKFDNFGILEGVTQSPDGTLYVAGNPFAANTISFSGFGPQVVFNGTPITFTPAAVKDVFITGGTEADVVDATNAPKNVLAFLGTGNDTYTGGNQTDAVQGGPGHDTLNGNAGADRLYGMIGNDSVNGGAGADIVSVGEGAPGATQTLAGGTEADLLMVSGTSFNDGILVWDPDNNPAAIGPSLQVRVTSPVSPAAGVTGVIEQSLTIAGVEPTDTLLVSASYGDDRVELENSAVANSRVRLPAIVFGGPGNDTLFDGLGADRLFADSGYTTLPGDGADELRSTDGTAGDVLVRKAGTDTVAASVPGDTIIDMT